MNKPGSLWQLCLICAASLRLAAVAQAGELRPEEIAASVAGHKITVGEVRLALEASLGKRPLSGESQTQAEAQTLEQLIHRRLVLLALDRAKITASDEELAAAKKSLARADAGAGRSSGAEPADWHVRWNKYLSQQITDQHLEEFFQAHRRDFDGTEVRASHILLKGDALGNPTVRRQLVEKANQLRREIAGGGITFAAAAEKYSEGPSRTSGGDLGFFTRHGSMAEAFSRAAFALAKGEISPPVISSFGVHLIQCTDIRPGKKSWFDVRSELAAAYAQEQFRKLADEMRPTVKIEYNPNVPRVNNKQQN